MRMRFCATMRSPAFSISALTAPVRLRAVASGLMIEKVRSIAMITYPWESGEGSCRAYIGATLERQATRTGLWALNYNSFTKVNSFCRQRRGCIHPGGNRVQSTQDLADWRLGEHRTYRWRLMAPNRRR